MAKSLQTLLSPGRFQRIFGAPVVRSKLRSAVCRWPEVAPGTGVSWQVQSVLVAESASMPRKKVPAPSAVASMNFSAEVEPGRTLYTKGELALPTMSTPPGATVKLSGCDFASAIKISAADAPCARHATRAMQTARCRTLEIGMVNLLNV